MSNDIQFEFRREDVTKATRLLAVVFVLVAVLVIGSKSIYTVQPNEVAVVLRFGKPVATVGNGLHFCIPLVDEVLTVDTRERTIRMPFGLADERPAGQYDEEDVLMLTGDLNAAAVEWSVQWRVSEAEPEKYLFTFYNSRIDQDEYLQAIITVVGRTVMNSLVGDYSIDEVLTSKRSEIREQAREMTQAKLDEYGCESASRTFCCSESPHRRR